MRQIIAFLLLIFFCSCTSSGKLTDAKFPYKFTYTPEPGTMLNVGTYSITPIIDVPCIDCMVAEMHLKVVEIFGIFLLILFIISLIYDKIKSHEKTTE